MPKEKELYRDTLERIRKRADKLYPDKLVYTQEEAAKIMGKHRNTIARHGLKTDITCERLARAFA